MNLKDENYFVSLFESTCTENMFETTNLKAISNFKKTINL